MSRRFLFLLAFGFCFLPVAFSQDPPLRDPQAIAILQQSFAKMGGRVPTDSVATGKVQLMEGSTTEIGVFRVLTRGLEQTAEFIETPESKRSLVYSRSRAKQEIMRTLAAQEPERAKPAVPSSMESAVTSQSAIFPLVLFGAALADMETVYEYVGLESIEGSSVHHVRYWKTFASKPKLLPLASLSARDVWIDVKTGLPVRISFERRSARGAAPGLLVSVAFTDYRHLGAVLYPFQVNITMNGTPWATITVDRVSLNTGLPDSDFVVDAGSAQ